MKAVGKFRRPLQKQWTKMATRQYFITKPLGMIFDAVMKHNSVMWFDIRDKYYQKKGGMFVNILSGLNVLNESDVQELNNTTFLRCIGEAVMFPTSLLPSEYIKWEPIDKNSANAIVTDGNNKGIYTFYFNDVGEIVKYESDDIRGDLKMYLYWRFENAVFSYKNPNQKPIFFFILFVYRVISMG